VLIKKKFTKYTFIVGIIILIFVSPIFSNTLSSMFSNSDNASPIYNVAIAADTQQNNWKLCEGKDFSYELLLSIYHADGIDCTIISRDMSIEGCKEYVKENPDYKDNEYLKKVTEYKYYLEQSLES